MNATKNTILKRGTLEEALTEEQKHIIEETLHKLKKNQDKKSTWARPHLEYIWALGFLAGLMNKKTL